MKFIGLDLVANGPDTAGQPGDPTRGLSEAVENAVLFEELGFTIRSAVYIPAPGVRIPSGSSAVLMDRVSPMTSGPS